MADNRMYLVHEASGMRVLLAKDFTGTWAPFRPGHLGERLSDAFKVEAEHTAAGLASTGWRLEYERTWLENE